MCDNSKLRFILASRSPRRRELLEKLGIHFEIIPAEADEYSDKKDFAEYVSDLSDHKAYEVLSRIRSGKDCGSSSGRVIIIASDTIVVHNGQILGKPLDEEDAFRMLSALQDSFHQVYTAVTVVGSEDEHSPLIRFCESATVRVYPMSENEIRRYIESSEPMDKAGAYAIQGIFAPYACTVSGDYNTVVGLPLARLHAEMKKAGLLS